MKIFLALFRLLCVVCFALGATTNENEAASSCKNGWCSDNKDDFLPPNYSYIVVGCIAFIVCVLIGRNKKTLFLFILWVGNLYTLWFFKSGTLTWNLMIVADLIIYALLSTEEPRKIKPLNAPAEPKPDAANSNAPPNAQAAAGTRGAEEAKEGQGQGTNTDASSPPKTTGEPQGS